MRTAIVIGILIGMLGCGDNDRAVSCGPCGQNLQCDGPIQQCISPGPCVTNAVGHLVLASDGTYTQDGGGGTFTTSALGVTLRPSAAPAVAALVSVSENSCPF